MSTTQPIRSKQLLHDFKDYYLTKQPNSRNYTLILIGLNTALRINDILHLTWGDVYCTPLLCSFCGKNRFLYNSQYSPGAFLRSFNDVTPN